MNHWILLHSRLIFTILLATIGCGLWAGYYGLRQRQLSAWFHSACWMIELLLIAEALLGVLIWQTGDTPARLELHLIYAAVSILTLPIALAWAKKQEPRAAGITLGVVCFFLSAIILRALQTARN